MCGIWALLSKNFASKYSKETLQSAFWNIKGRGPDATHYLRLTPNLIYGFHRLSICDTTMKGMQPFIHRLGSPDEPTRVERVFVTPETERTDEKYGTPIHENETYTLDDGDIAVQANGEIYNSFQLAEKYGFKFSSTSDCEIIPFLYKYFDGDIEKVCHALDGVFVFTLYDKSKDILFAGRDPIGVRPLFIGM